jgi:hypothetical protein
MTRTKEKKSAADASPALKFGKENVVLGTAGLLCLVLGYWLLARGSITAAPLLLVLAYVLLLPLAIIR